MDPSEARRWIAGRDIYGGADLADWQRYFIEEVPPARRDQAELVRKAWRERRQVELFADPDEVEPMMVLKASPDGTTVNVPTWIWIALRKEEK
jgi:hypothetical protein